MKPKKTDPETGSFTEYLADYLLDHGVIVLPCKVGDMVFMLQKIGTGHWEEDKYIIDDRGQWKIYEKKFSLYHIPDVGKTVFPTREEAERALKERENND